MSRSSQDISHFIRLRTAALTYASNSSHIGSVYSCADIVACIYHLHLNTCTREIVSKAPLILLSKGHACLSIYTALEYLGLLENYDLNTYGSNNTVFMSHVSHKVPHIPFSTGSLGHGLGLAVGMSLGMQAKGVPSPIYVVIGDGELQEGSVWEALMYIGAHNVQNIIPIIDYNNQQSFGHVSSTLSLEPILDKFISFGLEPFICNGHSHVELLKALIEADELKAAPPLILAMTTKGYPIDFMLDNHEWHYKSPNLENLKAIEEQLATYYYPNA